MHTKLARIGFVLAVLTAVVATTAVASGPGYAADANPPIAGAGSTWSANAIDIWRADVAKFGLRVNYQSVGSSAGRQFYVINQVDFAVSEIPFQPDEIARANQRPFVYLPIVAGGTALMYNLRNAAGQPVTNLRLDALTAAKIFTGQIKTWNHPEIAALNPGQQFPNIPIKPVVRSDGSGTSAQLSAYFVNRAPQVWGQFAAEQRIANSFTSNWPIFDGATGQNGSDGVANYVNNEATGVGGITYVEYSYAKERRRPAALIRNQAGNFTPPFAGPVAIALRAARLNPDRTQVLDGVYVNPDPNAYPISSYSYMIAPRNIDPAKGSVLARFVYYFVCAGQAKAEPNGYSPLPPNLVQAAFDATRQIPGAPAPPAFDRCANPTIGGTFDPGTLAAGGAAGSGSGDSGSGAAGTSGDAALGTDTALAEGEVAAGGSGARGSGRALPAASVEVSGSTGSTLPLVLAGLGLLLLVLVPPVVAGLLRKRQSSIPAGPSPG